MNTVWQDIRYGASMLSKTPGVSIVASSHSRSASGWWARDASGSAGCIAV